MVTAGFPSLLALVALAGFVVVQAVLKFGALHSSIGANCESTTNRYSFALLWGLNYSAIYGKASSSDSCKGNC